MIKKLKECEVGDIVRVYCIGWMAFDNQLSKIIKKGIFVTVKGEDGKVLEIVGDTKCQIIN